MSISKQHISVRATNCDSLVITFYFDYNLIHQFHVDDWNDDILYLIARW